MDNKVTILVACHKPDTVYQDDVYTPIHVGRAISQYKSEMSNMIGDDTGDNISEKNKSYCELTAQYWAWKNLHCEYIGLCHYRRYFEEKINYDNINKELKGFDIIVAKRVYMAHNLITWLKRDTMAEDAYILYTILVKLHPEYKSLIDECLTLTNFTYPCNMFICKKQLFDEYAEWQFRILSEVERFVKPSGYTRLKRNMGYFGEALLNIYLYIKKLKIKEMPLVSMVGGKDYIMNQSVSVKLRYKIHFILSNKTFNWNYAMLAGLKADGILQELEDYCTSAKS